MTRDVPDAEGAERGGAAPPVLHPYVGFAPRTLGEKMQRELGRYSADPAPDEMRVLILGGSVAGNFGRKGADALAAGLAERPELAGQRFTFVNYGLGAHKQPQQLLLANYLLAQGLRVDAVLLVDGFNEVALAAYNAEHGAHPTYPSLAHWGHLTRELASDPETRALVERVAQAQERALRWAERGRSGWLASALLGRWTLARALAARSDYAAAYDAYAERLSGGAASEAARGPGFAPGGATSVAVETWRRSSEQLAGLLGARGIAYLHVLQPTLHDEGSKPVTAEERASGSADPSWLRGAREGYPLLRAAGAELAASGVPFLDASRLFADVEETLYYDVCHFHAAGHRLLARAIAPALAAELRADR